MRSALGRSMLLSELSWELREKVSPDVGMERRRQSIPTLRF
jgi:hypothetical protein